MTEDFQAECEAKLAAYRLWAQTHPSKICRLVQFCGVDFMGAADVPLEEVQQEIMGLMAEGFLVDWALKDDCTFLRVWEYPGSEPAWDKVFKEESEER